MSQLETNTATIQNLIEKANSLPDAGSGGTGGTDISTCSVTISETGFSSSAIVDAVIVTELIDGNIIGENSYVPSNTVVSQLDDIFPITFNNIVCGTYICIVTSIPTIPGQSYDSGINLVSRRNNGASVWTFQVTQEAAGKSLNITIRDDD